ncbi:MAG: isochorismatase family protein [Hyphomicrobiaceae bacterium]
MLAIRERSHLVVIDAQERLIPTIARANSIFTNVARLIKYASRMGVPVTFTEHMPERSGPVLEILIRAATSNASHIQKAHFSSLSEPRFEARIDVLKQQGRDQVVIAGLEAHVCVLQTAMGLLARHFEVLVVADAVGSRAQLDCDAAIERMSKAGVAVVTQEMIAFEWLTCGDAPEYRDVMSIMM